MPATTYSYSYVEDYIEIIAGYRDASGKNKYSIFQLPESLINLARYDVKVLESFAEQIRNNVGFTDRQAKLATDLVLKYERQLRRNQVSIDPIKTNAQFKLPIRTIDRSTRVWIETDKIMIKFPYSTELIDLIRTESKTSLGSIHWDPAKKYWTADLTEYNLNWVYAFSKQQGFEIDPEVQGLMDLIYQVEQETYSIQLRLGNQLYITNAPGSLQEYVADQLGGFDVDNLIRLVDHAPIVGYSVDQAIEQAVISNYGPRFYSLCANRELKVDPTSAHQDQVKEIVSYAAATNRWPIYVYEPDMSDRLIMLLIRHFDSDQIVNLDQKESVTESTKLVYARKIPKTPVDSIPLLISSAGMLFGGDRQVWLQTAEKVVYFTKDVYNKSKKGLDICKLD